ncbi:MAG: hypothetical protein ACHREM_04395, partial [Polyangiales bacterium]
MSNYRSAASAPVPSAIERVVYRAMKPVWSALLIALVAVACGAMMVSMLVGARGTSLRCSKPATGGACTLTRDYRLFTTTRELPLSTILGATIAQVHR